MTHEIESQPVTLRGETRRGGVCNVHLVRCAPVRLELLRLVRPVGDLESDEHGKNILCDACQDVSIRRCYCGGGSPRSGDGINLYRCEDVAISECTIRGMRRHDDIDTAAGIVVDEGTWLVSVYKCLIEVPPPLAAIVIVGRDVEIADCRATGAVQIGLDNTSCDVGTVRLSRWRGPKPYIAPGTIGQVWLDGERIYCQP